MSEGQKPQAIIFDLDGTLCQFPLQFLFMQFNRAAETLGMEPFADSVLQEAFSSFDFFGSVDVEKRDEFMEVYWRIFDWENYPRKEVIPGVLEALEGFAKADIKLGLVTSRKESADYVRESISHTGLGDFLEAVVPRSSDDTQWMDKTDQIQKACRLLGVPSGEVIVVGDIPPDTSSARLAGVSFVVAVLSGGIKREVLAAAEPDLILNSVAELPPVVTT